MLLRKEQWVEVGAMQLDDDELKVINIRTFEVEQLLPEAKERIKEKALLDEDYVAICKQLSSGGNIDKKYNIQNNLLCCKDREYVPKGLRKRIMESEHDSTVGGHFGRERTMVLLTQIFYWPNMEMDVRKYCNECNNYHRPNAPRHAKHGLFHPFRTACNPWTHISTDYITYLL